MIGELGSLSDEISSTLVLSTHQSCCRDPPVTDRGRVSLQDQAARGFSKADWAKTEADVYRCKGFSPQICWGVLHVS